MFRLAAPRPSIPSSRCITSELAAISGVASEWPRTSSRESKEAETLHRGSYGIDRRDIHFPILAMQALPMGHQAGYDRYEPAGEETNRILVPFGSFQSRWIDLNCHHGPISGRGATIQKPPGTRAAWLTEFP